MNLSQVLIIFQIIISVLLVTAILLQQRGAGLGSAFGGTGASYFTKRGLEKWLFITTIILGILFALSSILVLILK